METQTPYYSCPFVILPATKTFTLYKCLLHTKTLDIRTTGDGAEKNNTEQVSELTMTIKENTGSSNNPKWVIMFNLHSSGAG